MEGRINRISRLIRYGGKKDSRIKNGIFLNDDNILQFSDIRKLPSRVRLFVTPWTVSLEFSRPEYWSR